jgi:hypothetical protein
MHMRTFTDSVHIKCGTYSLKILQKHHVCNSEHNIAYFKDLIPLTFLGTLH